MNRCGRCKNLSNGMIRKGGCANRCSRWNQLEMIDLGEINKNVLDGFLCLLCLEGGITGLGQSMSCGFWMT